MARARYDSSDESSADELPSLSDILSRRRNAKSTDHQSAPSREPKKSPPASADTPCHASSAAPGKPVSKKPAIPAMPPLVQKAKSAPVAPKRQRLLKPAFVDGRLARPVTSDTLGSIASLDESGPSLRKRSPTSAKRTPARAAKKPSMYLEDSGSDTSSMVQADSACSTDSESEEDVEESSWSASHDDSDHLSGDDVRDKAARRPHSPLQKPKTRDSSRSNVPQKAHVFDSSALADEARPSSTSTAHLVPPSSESVHLERPSSSSSADMNAVLTYSPPRTKSPHKVMAQTDRPRTPPPSAGPTQSRFTSPKKSFIPSLPHRPSLDAFWSADVVNSWNDQHSPRKVLQPSQKTNFGSPDDDKICPVSPQKRSPAKRDPSRKSFEQRKHQLAEDFLHELDMTITKGQISSLTAESGGVKLVWSKTLNTTAGRANWKKESVKIEENGIQSARPRHYASIELAEKVIDDEDRLVNVIAHEFCHLTNFMISNIRDNPHGKEFKQWAKQVTQAFSSRNVNVTTKHTYEIDYKYVWTCVSCKHEFKRHSKSIDPSKHRCGSCKSELMQTKPAVRQKDPNKGPNGYQVFMKENFQRIKRENEGKSHKDIMDILGREYRESKINEKGSRPIDGDHGLKTVTRAVEAITLNV